MKKTGLLPLLFIALLACLSSSALALEEDILTTRALTTSWNIGTTSAMPADAAKDLELFVDYVAGTGTTTTQVALAFTTGTGTLATSYFVDKDCSITLTETDRVHWSIPASVFKTGQVYGVKVRCTGSGTGSGIYIRQRR